MARRNTPPMAPARPGFWLRQRTRRAGRKDARTYQSVQDFTRTHVIIGTQNRVRHGQRRVNTWVITRIEPIQAGNLTIQAQQAELSERRSALAPPSTDRGSLGRAKRRYEHELAEIDAEAIDLAKQYDSNIASAERILRAGSQAIGSWKNFYEQVAAEYARAKLSKTGKLAASNSAEIPRFTGEPLEYYETFASIYEQMAEGA